MRALVILGFTLLTLSIPAVAFAQEPSKTLDVKESAEVMLEEYTDEFQEAFFEAIKQKGIQNYDRASNLFLECKRLQPENHVIDHELAKTFQLDNKHPLAQQYAIDALNRAPENYWYLDTLIEILAKQSNSLEAIAKQLPGDNEGLRRNLAIIYYKRQEWSASERVLKKLDNSDFKQQFLSRLAKAQKLENIKSDTKPTIVEVSNDPVKSLELSLARQLESGQYGRAEMQAKEAVELYPLQPFFYYAYGVSLHKNNKNSQAIDVLESGLDFLFDDISLANKFFQALADAHLKTNNNSRANEYLSKIKPGF